MSADPCPDCAHAPSLPSPVASLRQCTACQRAVFLVDIDRIPTWTIVIPGDVARSARAGDLAPILPAFAGAGFSVPLQNARPWGEHLQSWWPDLDAWADALDAYEGPRHDWVFSQLRAGLDLVRSEARVASVLPVVEPTWSTPAPVTTERRAFVDRVEGTWFVSAGDGLFAWRPPHPPRRLWTGVELEPVGGGLWKARSSWDGTVLRVTAGGVEPAAWEPSLRTDEPGIPGAVLPGASVAQAQGEVWFEQDGARIWTTDGRVEWAGERFVLAVREDEIEVIDAFTGDRSPPIPRPEPEQRALGGEAHGGVYVSNGVHVTFATLEGARPWTTTPFPVHAVQVAGDRVIFGCNQGKPRAVLGREGLTFDGTVTGRIGLGPQQPPSLAPRAVPAAFVTDAETWRVYAPVGSGPTRPQPSARGGGTAD